MATWEQVRRYALALPDTVERTSRGSAVWTVNKKLFAWERPLRASDLAALGDRAPSGDILALRTAGLEMKEALLARDPRVYFTTPHFAGYAAVLVVLKRIAATELQPAIAEAWLAAAPQKAVRSYLATRKRAPWTI